ncbi:MAG: sodium-dependent transporter [Clostridia bacterium]|nr:sodium-dependent transporter [Clostridia bacterium]
MHTELEKNAKENFGSRIGFILAAAGSAIGLGNIWRFPYLAARYGGGIFLIVYILLALTFGFSLMVTEIAIGRRTGKSVIGAYKAVNKRFGLLGYIAALVPIIITPYYCVIGGWVLKYFTAFASGSGRNTAGDGSFFSNYIGDAGDTTLFFVVFLVLTAAVIFLGVRNGIETISKFLMPVLLALLVGIMIYTLTLPGAGEGLRYYILPDFNGMTVGKLLKTIVAAMGQLFYSMSLAMGIMVTYGSYMRKEDSIEKSSREIGFFDTAVAILAGAIIVPAVFVFSGGDASQLNAGPSLMYITLPNVFDSMVGGQIVGAAFFALVALAALTSSISLLETVASILAERFHLKRVFSTVLSVVLVFLVGMLSVLGYSTWSDVTIFGYQFLDFFDFISNNIMMPVVALLTCILIGYFAKTAFVEEEIESEDTRFRSKKLYRVMVMVVCPIFMIVILLTPFVLNI